MSLAPLLEASPQTRIHAFAAMVAFALGLVQFTAPKGTRCPIERWDGSGSC